MEGIKVNKEPDEWPSELIREDLKDLWSYIAERLAQMITVKTDSCLPENKRKRKKQN